MAEYVAKVKGMMTGDIQQKSLLSTVDEAVTLSWKNRLIGFGCCFGLGAVLSIISIPMLWSLNITRFVIFYTIGSVISICSTMFLMGPVNQIKRMFEQNRILATVVYLLSIVLTLVFAFTLKSGPLCLVMLVIQFCALIWYCLTWIPGGQAALKAIVFRSSG